MASPLSVDLRTRVVTAISGGAASSHQAAARFGVSVVSASRCQRAPAGGARHPQAYDIDAISGFPVSRPRVETSAFTPPMFFWIPTTLQRVLIIEWYIGEEAAH